MCVLASGLTFEHVGTFVRIKPLLGLSDFSAFNLFKSISKVFETVYNIVWCLVMSWCNIWQWFHIYNWMKKSNRLCFWEKLLDLWAFPVGDLPWCKASLPFHLLLQSSPIHNGCSKLPFSETVPTLRKSCRYDYQQYK